MPFPAFGEELRGGGETARRLRARPVAHDLVHPAGDAFRRPRHRLHRYLRRGLADVQLDDAADPVEAERLERAMAVASLVDAFDDRGKLRARGGVAQEREDQRGHAAQRLERGGDGVGHGRAGDVDVVQDQQRGGRGPERLAEGREGHGGRGTTRPGVADR